MHLDKGEYKPSSLKGEILHYDQELTNQSVGTDRLVTFTSQRTPRSQLFEDHDFQLGAFVHWKRTLFKDLLPHCWKGPCQVPNR